MSFTLPKQPTPSQPKKPSIISIPSGALAAEILQQENAPSSNQPSTVPQDSKPVTLQFDRDMCQQHLDAVAEHMEQYAGKIGMNPYMWLERFLKPLYYRMEGLHPFTSTSQDPEGNDIQPEQSAELQKEILSLPLNEEPSMSNIFKRRKLTKHLLTNGPSEKAPEVPQGLQ